MTLGVGTWGGSIISENVTAKHLMNIKTLAFETNPINKGNSINSFGSSKVGNSYTSSGNFINEIEERLRARAGNPVVNFQSTSNKFTSQKIYQIVIKNLEME